MICPAKLIEQVKKRTAFQGRGTLSVEVSRLLQASPPQADCKLGREQEERHGGVTVILEALNYLVISKGGDCVQKAVTLAKEGKLHFLTKQFLTGKGR